MKNTNTDKTENRNAAPATGSRDGEPINAQGTTPTPAQGSTARKALQAASASPATETIIFYTSEATARRIYRRAAINGRSPYEEMITMFQGDYPDPDYNLFSSCWTWELEVSAELAARAQAFATAARDDLLQVAERIVIERLDELETEEAASRANPR